MLHIERTSSQNHPDLDADARKVIEFWLSKSTRPIQEVPLHEARNSGLITDEITGPARPLHAVTDTFVQSVDGYNIPIRTYQPTPVKEGPVLIYAHGGGWTLLSIDTCDVFLRELAAEVNCVVVSVGYRLAPEYPYPIPFNDCWDVLTWVASGGLGVLPDRIAVGGDSAGGNMAAGLALKSRDRGDGLVDFQLLLYPACGTDLETPSMKELGPDPRFRLSKEAMSYFWNNYLAGNMSSTDPYAIPHLAASYQSVASALVVTAGFDPLKDDGENYAKKLGSNGVEVELLTATTLPHGFVFTLGIVPESRRVVNIIFRKIKEAFSKPKNGR
jgi:acetyl esterase